MTRYAGKTAIITGAGTGIGAAIAERFAEEGGNVILTGRRAAPLDAVAARTGGVAVAGDASDGAHMSGLVDLARDRFGGLDVMVCNAGGFGFGTLTETGEEDWSNAVQANLTTAYASARAALPALTERRGNVLMMASIAGLAAGPEACGYVTMKHGLLGLAKSIARDFGPQGVRCNAICPGWVRTEMADMEMAELMERKGLATVDEAYALVTRDVPLRQPADGADVAAAAAFLCSDEARMITGSILTVDGGAIIVDVPTLAF
ncbi:SDR family NAD(P)-dependent oxidoreductase [Psychromarinibacter sp. C21-152]|uniref:SDR family NAD(P)-dependent oxidoreductase n=1 Tax=Psychromarinibacter sediminicola TaxID=3033385 RepID=A0AAE3TBG4_9RHOB|nr:SDR family oxidoreductase [Psychromarinibacter sediminicola]MDF0603009.1 SDR family NAD(P)-dependent oxidoreductase [Psychromarinibacter sediminicola]